MESELHAGQKDSYLLEFSEVLLDLYGSQYASRIEMLYRLVKNWGKEQYRLVPHTATLISEGLKVNKESHNLKTYAFGNQQHFSAENRKLIEFYNLIFMLTLAYVAIAGGCISG